MKIGIDIRNIGKKRTGDEVVFFNLVKNLAEIDKNNEYKLFTDITNEDVLNKIKKDLNLKDSSNFEVVAAKPLRFCARFVWNFWTLPRYLRKNPVDIYLTQYITPWFVSRSVKIATIIHDISFNFYPQFIKFSDLFFLKTLIPMSLKRADKVIAVSQFTRDEIIKYYKVNPEKVEWIHNAVSEDFLCQDISVQKIEKVRKKYNLPEKFILYLGTLQPRKNLPVLIEAYSICHSGFDPESLEIPKQVRDNIKIKLVIAGGRGHNYDKKIDEAVEKYNLGTSVIFPGFIDEEDKAALIAASEVFVLPSLYEGFGIPILEAMSVGIPVIASDIAPHREIAGEAVLFFNPKNAVELAEKLSILLSDETKRKELIEKGKEQAKKFSWRTSAEKMLAIFKSLK